MAALFIVALIVLVIWFKFKNGSLTISINTTKQEPVENEKQSGLYINNKKII